MRASVRLPFDRWALLAAGARGASAAAESACGRPKPPGALFTLHARAAADADAVAGWRGPVCCLQSWRETEPLYQLDDMNARDADASNAPVIKVGTHSDPGYVAGACVRACRSHRGRSAKWGWQLRRRALGSLRTAASACCRTVLALPFRASTAGVPGGDLLCG